MTNTERFEKYCKVFPKAGLTEKEWAATKNFIACNLAVTRLDMSIFPDATETVDVSFSNITTLVYEQALPQLSVLTLSHNHLTKVELPEGGVLVELNVASNPLLKLRLGGATKTLETLNMGLRLNNPRVKVPTGMVNLTELIVGSKGGTVFLPEDATNISNLIISSGKDTKVRIPATYTKLANIAYNGAGTFTLPSDAAVSLEGVGISGSLEADAVLLPKSIAGVKELIINHRESKVVGLPKEMPNLTSLYLGCANDKLVLPQAEALTSLHVRSVKEVIVPTKHSYPNLKEVTIIDNATLKVGGEFPKLTKFTSASVDTATIDLRGAPKLECLFVGSKSGKVQLPEGLEVGPNVSVDIADDRVKEAATEEA